MIEFFKSVRGGGREREDVDVANIRKTNRTSERSTTLERCANMCTLSNIGQLPSRPPHSLEFNREWEMPVGRPHGRPPLTMGVGDASWSTAPLSEI